MADRRSVGDGEGSWASPSAVTLSSAARRRTNGDGSLDGTAGSRSNLPRRCRRIISTDCLNYLLRPIFTVATVKDHDVQIAISGRRFGNWIARIL
ncbi:hypothetical protein TIFTF001_035402 [Ficus carica]|uniref:Uncharacterized protein n=1 Tax=Ficus carica TaxID=3494 RepID=A0AA88JA09_FICCA|nr:hypothetical protein TIFTF001_035383 [Ficus carica]GMN66320.1 hypothetical protein TIFTF001_035386 [Ficus carica]GMN66329.1 hypothetical protein TIFTF001_035399 [Ficus carica]GMN66336.1 hypothetical protein TIFTF001_035402 [Ficus carica]